MENVPDTPEQFRPAVWSCSTPGSDSTGTRALTEAVYRTKSLAIGQYFDPVCRAHGNLILGHAVFILVCATFDSPGLGVSNQTFHYLS